MYNTNGRKPIEAASSCKMYLPGLAAARFARACFVNLVFLKVLPRASEDSSRRWFIPTAFMQVLINGHNACVELRQ